ncbi:MAG: nucleoside hydrolase [Oscillospiraceae bacterium]|nr:nucleoside hydrolase [Oscillospiraceae bacterium]
MDTQKLLSRLSRPAGKIDVVLDTDTYNEIDDQFALAYMVRSCEKLNVKAVYAAPFFNSKSSGPADGMEKSYREIHKILSLMGEDGLMENVFKGSDRYLESETQPVISPAAEHLAALAMRYTGENPLYVAAIGAITNVASAILINPAIIENIVVVWLGGNSLEWHDNREFNCRQDVAAARVIFGCGVPLVQLPCAGVVSAFTVSGPELEYWLKGKNKLCDYLAQYTCEEGLRESGVKSWSRVIWDVTAIAWLLDGDFLLDRLEHSPIPEYDHHYARDPRRHFIRYVYHVNRDKLFADLIGKLVGENIAEK